MGEGSLFRECSFISLRATRKQPTPTLIKKKSEWGRASPTPVRLPPAAGPPSRLPAAWLGDPSPRVLHSQDPGLAGVRRRGPRKGLGTWWVWGLGGGAVFSPPHPLPAREQRPSSLPSSLSLPRTFPGQLGLKFSGEAPRARGIRGRLGSAQDPLQNLPPTAPVGCRARHSAGRRRPPWRRQAPGGWRAGTCLSSEFSFGGREGRGAANPVLSSAPWPGWCCWGQNLGTASIPDPSAPCPRGGGRRLLCKEVAA